MANGFTKQELTYFEEQLETFEDQLVISKLVSRFETNMQEMQRGNYTVWRPRAYTLRSQSITEGQAVTFGDTVELSVPATINNRRELNFTLTDQQLSDTAQANKQRRGAIAELASQINQAVLNTAITQGSVIVANSGAAGNFASINAINVVFDQTGVGPMDRKLVVGPTTNGGIASDLAIRQTLDGKAQKAYERSIVGMVAGMELHKSDVVLNVTGNSTASGVVTITSPTAYNPQATTTDGIGNVTNVDNRYQNITVNVGAGGVVRAGDCFTIAGCYAVHQQTKQSTGALKTFRVIEIISGGGAPGTNVLKVSAPMIVGNSAAQMQYQNIAALPANNAAITFLNKQTAEGNPFWHMDAIELLPGRLGRDESAQGAAVLTMTTDNGVEIMIQKFRDIVTSKTMYRFDTLIGTVCTNPEMAGVLLYGQA